MVGQGPPLFNQFWSPTSTLHCDNAKYAPAVYAIGSCREKSPLFPFLNKNDRSQLRKNRSWRHCDRSYYVTQVRFPPPHLLHLDFCYFKFLFLSICWLLDRILVCNTAKGFDSKFRIAIPFCSVHIKFHFILLEQKRDAEKPHFF